MADPRPAPRSGLGVVAAVFALFACGPTNQSDPRLLDVACQATVCQTTGSAVQTTGITDDAVGFHLGPGAGTLTIQLPPGTPFTAVQVLVEGQGSFQLGLQPTPGERADGGNAAGTGIAAPPSQRVPRTYDWVSAPGTGSMLVIEAADDGSSIDIADLRTLTATGCN